MNQPSSTITAAFLWGAGMTILWQLYSWLIPLATDIPFLLNPPEALVAGSVTFVSAYAGYKTKETVYPNGAPWVEGQ